MLLMISNLCMSQSFHAIRHLWCWKMQRSWLLLWSSSISSMERCMIMQILSSSLARGVAFCRVS